MAFSVRLLSAEQPKTKHSISIRIYQIRYNYPTLACPKVDHASENLELTV